MIKIAHGKSFTICYDLSKISKDYWHIEQIEIYIATGNTIIYKSLFVSHINYGLLLWGTEPKKFLTSKESY